MTPCSTIRRSITLCRPSSHPDRAGKMDSSSDRVMGSQDRTLLPAQRPELALVVRHLDEGNPPRSASSSRPGPRQPVPSSSGARPIGADACRGSAPAVAHASSATRPGHRFSAPSGACRPGTGRAGRSSNVSSYIVYGIETPCGYRSGKPADHVARLFRLSPLQTAMAPGRTDNPHRYRSITYGRNDLFRDERMDPAHQFGLR